MQISRLHYITQDLPLENHASLAEKALKGGVKWVQFRAKTSSKENFWEWGLEVKELCKRYGATFIVNDSLELAKELKADGVHLGQDDGSLREASKVLGDKAIIGGTANSISEIVRCAEGGADYIGVGPFRFTSTKKTLKPILSYEGIHFLIQRMRVEGINIPIIAIGGIELEVVRALLAVGAYGVAIASAINKANCPSVEAANFVNVLERKAAGKNRPGEILEVHGSLGADNNDAALRRYYEAS